MSMGRDLRHTWRSLWRTPLFTTAVIVTLTIGIASVASIFAVVNAVLFRALPYADPSRLVGVLFDIPAMSMRHTQIAPGFFVSFRRYAHPLEDIAGLQSAAVNAMDADGNGNPER